MNDEPAECQKCGLHGGCVLHWTTGSDTGARWVCPHCATLVEDAAAVMLKALKWIVQGRGAFDSDPRQHAANVIEEARACAKDAIERAEAWL